MKFEMEKVRSEPKKHQTTGITRGIRLRMQWKGGQNFSLILHFKL